MAEKKLIDPEPVDLDKVAAGATASDRDLPTNQPQGQSKDNPFVALVEKADADGLRYDLPGRYSLVPFPGRKHANELGHVVNALNRAARAVGVKLRVRQVTPNGTDAGLCFKVAQSK